MHLQRIVPETKFRILSEEYATNTGLPLLLINKEGEIINGVRTCTVCKQALETCADCKQALAGMNSVLMNKCQKKMSDAIHEAFRWGQGYITNCPLGLIMFAAPIILDSKLIGGFLSGFAIFPKMRQDFADELAQNLKDFCEILDVSKLHDLEIRVISLKKVRDDVSYLLRLTSQFQINDLSVLEDRKAKYVQQYKIANFLDDLKKSKSDVTREILDKQEEIIQKVKLGDETGAREILNQFLGSIFFESGMNSDFIKVRIIELVVIISRAAMEEGMDAKDLMGLNYSYLTDLIKKTDLDELLFKLNEILINFIARVSATKKNKKKVKVKKIIDYIDQNFTRKLSSEEIARVGNLSTSRCLHLFKEETGLSFSDYVKELRVEYGKYLILNTDMSFADCAIEVGFFDQTHFTKTFKQVENMTPSQFQRKYKI